MTKTSMVMVSLLATLFITPATAQSALTLRLVSPSTAGGGSDTLARILGDQISRKQGRTVVIENRPGAGNIIGTEYVARSAPDGTTVLITTPEFVINPHLKQVNLRSDNGLRVDLLLPSIVRCRIARSRIFFTQLTKRRVN